jgi:predicted heme/steroid binding protein
MTTRQNLSKYNSTNPEIRFGVLGVVYDVSNSESFQDKGGYSMFAGHDATYCLAKMSLDKIDVGRSGEDIVYSEKELEDLKGWVRYFDEKYVRVGRLEE